MKRLALAAVLLATTGCGEKTVPTVAKTPSKPGEPPRPFAPAHNKGDWEDPRLKELREPPRTGRTP